MKKQDIKDLMSYFDETGLSKLKIKDENFEIEFEKVITTQNTVQIKSPREEIIHKEEQENIVELKQSKNELKSPMVGTFYKAPAPGAKAFVEVGSIVKQGDTIAIVEAMKIMNEIEAEFNCKIIKALVEDGQPVEYGMPLFAVEKM